MELKLKKYKALKFGLLMVIAIFFIAGCSVGSVVGLKGAGVAVHTKSVPLKINGENAGIGASDLSSVRGMTINTATGRVEPTGDMSDVLQTYHADAVALPADFIDAGDIAVEAVNLNVSFSTPGESHNMAIVVNGAGSEATLVAEVKSGSNTISADRFPKATWDELNTILKNSDSIDITFYVDGNPATITLSEISIAAVLEAGTKF